MKKLFTTKDILTTKDIEKYIHIHETEYLPTYEKMDKYARGKNPTIMEKKAPDPNNPDNRSKVSYGRKIITTFTGYAYRPGYITYKSENEQFLNDLNDIFKINKEQLKTSQHGKNTGVFGVSYELLYLSKNDEAEPGMKSELRFAVLDPREVILLYDDAIEPKAKIAIRYYKIEDNKYSLTVYYADEIVTYELEKTYDSYKFSNETRTENYLKGLPVVAFYLNVDDIMGIIEPVVDLIDDYDVLVSDSMNEWNRFANAYLRLVKMSLGDMSKDKSPFGIIRSLQDLKRRRVWEKLPEKEAVSFLTKDIPTEYIKFMADLVREQIHIQSHVPDLNSGAFAENISGVAIQRLMFDFENVVSNAEAEFDTALYERIEIIEKYLGIKSMAQGTYDEITISHKRNAPLNLKEFADTALVMKNAGFSNYLAADIMPDDIIPDVQEELDRQQEEML
ncbi:MAG: phage portal protein, partial [Nitrososphaerota archaeon]